MNTRTIQLSLIAVAAISYSFGADVPVSRGEEVKPPEPKAILEKVQAKMNKAKAFSVTTLEEKGGVKIETKCVVRQHGKGVISCRQEQRALMPGALPQPFVSITDHNKLYFFPTGCGNVIVRMKYLETREPNSPVANLFFPDGTFEMLKRDDNIYSIRYTCTPNEVKEIKEALRRKLGTEIKRDMTPAVLDYKIDRKSSNMAEAAVYSERGKLITKVIFKDWQFNTEIPDFTFEIPKDYKQYVVKSEKEAEKLQTKLMKEALAEQAKQQQDKKHPQKKK